MSDRAAAAPALNMNFVKLIEEAERELTCESRGQCDSCDACRRKTTEGASDQRKEIVERGAAAAAAAVVTSAPIEVNRRRHSLNG